MYATTRSSLWAFAGLTMMVSVDASAEVVNGRIQRANDMRPGGALQLEGLGSQTSVTTGIVAPGTPAQSRPNVIKQPSQFVHPIRNFSLTIPAGVVIYQRGEEKHLTMRSPEGYLLNVQTGDRNGDIPLPSMLARLEQRYLGEQGPWHRKLNAEEMNVGGLLAISALYRGHSARTRVVIARGAKTDFVFTFLSPTDLFERQERTFEWVLDNFKPDSPELTKQATAAAPNQGAVQPGPGSAPQPIHAGGSVASLADGRPAPDKPDKPRADMKRFVEPGFGFMMNYPIDWQMNKPTAFTATFSGPEGSQAYDAVVAVQNVRPGNSETKEQSATAAAADLLSSLSKSTDGMKIIAEGNLAELPGSQFVAKYSYAGKAYRKWAVVVPRPEGQIAHVWSYTAPDAAFDQFQPVAQSMLRSWTLTR
ncbi:MAG: hypothetical protein VW268_14605 [Rhodospirillaceae bacterium]